MKADHDNANPWLTTRTRTGAEYDAPYEARAQAGIDIHGEANLVDKLLQTEYVPQDAVRPLSVMDAGCGTGRMAIELARRGYNTVGVDLDPVMLRQASAKAPHLSWILANLATVGLTRQFDAVAMAGNVMIFLTPGSELAVLTNLTDHLKQNGLLVAAFELTPPPWSKLTLEGYEQMVADLGLTQLARWSTWDQDAWHAGDNYVVSVYRK